MARWLEHRGGGVEEARARWRRGRRLGRDGGDDDDGEEARARWR
jgi:hypothetical protein